MDEMFRKRSAAARKESRARESRLGFRVDAQTKRLVARAAELQRRSLTDFCLTALAEAARNIFTRREMLDLSERHRHIFFKTLINPPKPNGRLKRAFKAACERIAA
jgi:uncharacterized protein (DUF1778 family)